MIDLWRSSATACATCQASRPATGTLNLRIGRSGQLARRLAIASTHLSLFVYIAGIAITVARITTPGRQRRTTPQRLLTMLPPPPKSKAASIWSFDSGYGSNTLEDDEGFQVRVITDDVFIRQAHIDVFQVDYAGSSSAYQTLPPSTQQPIGPVLGGSWNVQIEDQLRLRRPNSPIQTLTTRLNVFTTKVGSSTGLQFPASSSSRDACVTCQLWDITNPGENLKCDECSGRASVTPEIVHRLDEQPKAKDATPQDNRSERRLTARCSACEISELIDSVHFVACASCTPNLDTLSPPLPIKPSGVKRSSTRRPPTKLESHALRILQGWLRENRSNPYPNTDTKRSLAERCGITEKQVNTWFTNARARRTLVNPADQSTPASEDEGSRKPRLSSVASTAAFDHSISASYATPFNYRGSDAPHSVTNSFNQTGTISCRRGKKKDYGQISLISHAPQQASLMPPAPLSETTISTEKEPDMWQCTFCYQQVARKSWRRHEETQHRPKRKWTCLHTGPTLTLPSRSSTSTVCVFCMTSNPSEEHLERSHRITECSQKSEDDRTFLRPDHLRQHVKNFHKSSLKDAVRDAWRREGLGKDFPENWTCGFCAQDLKSWDARETHIAGHFKHSLTMADWDGFVRPDEPSKKRPTSSEGRPSVFAKLARTLTGRSMRQQQQQPQPPNYNFLNTFDPIPTSADAIKSTVPLLPDMLFDSFMADVCGDTSGTTASELYPASDTRCDPGFPGEETLGFDFDALTADYLDVDISDFTGLWYQ
jgi:hypothetical protein